MRERAIKGSVLTSRLAFVERKLGKAGVSRVLAHLGDEDRAVLEGIILPAGWYPFDVQERLDDAIVFELGGKESVYKELGANSAELNLSASQKVYVRARDPHGLLKSAAAIYRLYYASGERAYEHLGDRRALLRTTGSETFSRHDCLTIVGWHEKAIEMCGGKRARVRETKCKARGDDCCEYLCEWD